MERNRIKVFFEGRLVNNIYKILPLYEEKNIGYKDYVHSLIMEINGIEKAIDVNDTNLLSLIGVLQSISDVTDNDSHAIVKREVFKAIKLSKAIAENVVI